MFSFWNLPVAEKLNAFAEGPATVADFKADDILKLVFPMLLDASLRYDSAALIAPSSAFFKSTFPELMVIVFATSSAFCVNVDAALLISWSQCLA